MKTLKLTLFLVSSILVIACSKSGTKALEKGDYYNATLQAIEKLKKDIDNEKSMTVLGQAYGYAKEELLADIGNARKANEQFKYERVLDNYAKLNILNDRLTHCVPCRKIVNPVAYFKEAEEARDLAANERYLYAESMLSKQTIEGGRAAFASYEKLFQFAPNFKDVRQKMDLALDMGSYHVVLETPIVNSKLYSYSNEYFADQLSDFVKNNRRMNQFIRFYSPEEAVEVKLQPDQIVQLEFVDFVVGQTLVERNKEYLISTDSVKTGSATVEGKKVDVFGKVYAELTLNRKVVVSRGLLSMLIKDFKTGRVLQKREFPGEFTWVNEWASYNGDERALTKEQLALCSKKEDLPPPPQQLFVEFCKPIYDQVTSEVKRFYSKY